MIRRINLFSGPGCGKSTLSAYIFYALKIKGFNIELVQEYVKKMVYEGTKRRPFDQLKMLERQIEREEIVLAYNTDSIVVSYSVLKNGAFPSEERNGCNP